MTTRKRILLAANVLMAAMLACNLPAGGPTPTLSPQTAAALTLEAAQTATAF